MSDLINRLVMSGLCIYIIVTTLFLILLLSQIIHHHVAPSAQISLGLSRHPSLSSIASGRSSGLHSKSAQSCCYVYSCWSSCLCSSMWRGPQEYVTYEFILSSPRVSRMSGSSTCIVFVKGGKWLYSCCFFGCFLQDLFKIGSSILV